MTALSQKRPKHLNLFQIRQPIGAIASILHRISGVGLFLMLPFLIWLFELSLGTEAQQQTLLAVFSHPVVKLLLTGLLWAFLHHFCMGIRILLIDIHVGVARQPARASAWAVLGASLAMTLVLGAKLW